MKHRENIERAKKLKPGDKLWWSRPPKGQSPNGYGESLARHWGEPVEFVSFVPAEAPKWDDTQINGQRCRVDMTGLPLVVVRGQAGEQQISLGWFDLERLPAK